MERIKKKMKKKNNFNLNFENDELEQQSIKRIREDFFNTILSRIFVIISLVLYSIISFYLFPVPNSKGGSLEDTYSITGFLNFTIVWFIIVVLGYFLFYILKLVFYKNRKQFVVYLEKEILMLGFKNRVLKVGLKYFIFTNIIFYLIVVLFKDQLYTLININLLYILFFFIIYVVIAVVTPVILGSYQNKIKILLKRRIFIKIDFKIKTAKSYNDLINKIYLHLRSNRLCLKFNRSKSNLFFKISKRNWLPKSGKFKSFSKFTPYHHFFEFSTPINFQNKLLNLVLLLREWDKKIQKNCQSL
ncbi:MAG: hypothetical protein KGD63_09365 [Candidatus Lokiarchaeota archaeon]|nr:hypothetical protein [Candidatus Lokiarchaeota archaeon]